ncbi:MAG: ABC transporter ATP-binding protein [Firmicutes bacterium]|nr:ABC transporter ATP-binding protein [Bacillota bacterium]
MESNFKLTGKQKVSLTARYLKGCTALFLLSLAFSCLAQVFSALLPQIIRFAVDGILKEEPVALPSLLSPFTTLSALQEAPLTALWICAGAALLAAIARAVSTFLQRITLSKGSERFVKHIRDDLYHHIQRLSFSWHTANPTGDMIQRCTSDVDVIRMFVCNQLIEVVRIVFLIVLYMSIMFSMNVRLSLVALAFLPIVGGSSGLFFSRISRRFQAADEAEGALTTTTQENLTGVRVVKAFGRERYEMDRFQEKNQRFSTLWIQLGKLMSVYWASGTFLTSIQVLVIILFGVPEAVRGDITLGEFLAFISYNAMLAWPVRSLGRVLSDMSKAGVSMDRVGYITTAQEEQNDPGAEDLPAVGDIEFRNVSFSYEEQPVLKDVSFTIPGGSTFAILGSTGSGKSTLAHLLDRLFDPEEGRITIGGKPLNAFTRESLRRQIGLVLQEPFLFSRTLADNIKAVRPDATDEQMRQATRIACIDEAISDFPEGYNTMVGERGVTLSGGQKQRVAIARMLLQKAPIMIFDDSLSAVDAETDQKIRNALRENLGGSTVILISHRITTLMQADKILVLDKGRVVDLGTHGELISRPGMYRDIYDIQMSSDDRALMQEGGM